jgi:uncharacterized YccA/Bax inhibitor family protein
VQSSNPVFQRSAGFNGRTSTNAYGNQTYPGGGMTYPGYGQQGTGYSDPSTWGRGGGPQAPGYVDRGRMTIDTVVQKTGITLGLTILVAAATWLFTGNPANPAEARTLLTLWMAGAIVGFVIGLVLSFKKTISPALVLVYAVVEGVFIGAMSKYFETLWPGVVIGAVIGTFAAVAGTLGAYKFFNIRVSARFRKFVIAATFGFVALVLLDFVLGFFGAAIGINGFGGLGLVMSIVGLGLGVLMLILDFDFIERGIAAQLPEDESWRAAFGLTVTIIWIYIEMLRILAILRGGD